MSAAAPGALDGLDVTGLAGQVNQRLKGWEAVRWVDGTPQVTDVLRAEVDAFGGIGALYGVLRADPWSAVRWGTGVPPERSAEAYAAVQEHVMGHGDGLPVLFVEEAPHGLMALGGSMLPVNLAQGAAMDPQLTRELGAAVAAEARERGTHLLLISGLDVLRDPRWGRAEECYSEDPAIAALLVEAAIGGLQGAGAGERIDAAHVAVVAKHLAGQGAGIGGRNGSGAPIGPRELGEIHLRPAFAAARAGVAGFMSAYNDVDGVPCTGNRDLLTGTLREDWGWEGIVMSDGGAIDRLVPAAGGGSDGGAADGRRSDGGSGLERAAALALHAGVDLSLWDQAYTHVGTAIEAGLVEEATLRRAAGRVLALKERLRLLGPENTGPDDERRSPATWPSARSRETVALSARAAREAVVVLEGGDLLPLTARRVAVVGPNADDLHALLGDYTPPPFPEDPEALTVRAALAARLGEEAVLHARGSRLRSPADPGDLAAVTRAAEEAEVTIAVLGGTSRRSYEDEFAANGAVEGPAADTTNGEGVDLADVALPAAQIDVVRAAREAGGPVVAVVVDGRPRALDELAGLVDALLLVPFPGPAGGRAIAEALLDGGTHGLLPATLPAASGTTPVSHDQRLETARGYVDQRAVRGPLLGAGLPSGLRCRMLGGDRRITAGDLDAGATLEVRVRIESERAGTVSVPVLLYGRRHEPGILPRTRTVLAAARAEVPRGVSEQVITLGLDALGSWAIGAPRAVPAEVELWTQPVLEPPADAVRVRITG
ncbi:glycoside hydrolase family 3 C-terminal domain-containing protein [Brachybacterium sp. NBEC-018]|uniref:glycoside hydrolase family 3 protein n=1 Tax=Brachybacterium sp. NBEC-018 TaxID=2996004 RepID=UPI0021750DA4|nr:glycoside hydrolase family 3 N-terminal domain-containing protein [Brachybacterium sp. NBEC-018]UVY84058.1 glycoside hydrolase family 3 C-terminal domain-containing protein [Brachybacterium sp. NBEC-018]